MQYHAQAFAAFYLDFHHDARLGNCELVVGLL
jgi:hypothetical protein